MTRQVVFSPSGRRGAFPEGTTVLDAARALGVDLDSVCGGRGICGRCQVVIGSRPGVEARADRLSELGPTETDYQGRRPLGSGHRLGCAARIVDDVVIDVPPDSQVHRQVVRKRAGVAALPVDPVVRLHYIEVPEPDLASPTGDLERLLGALEQEWGLTGLVVDSAVLRILQATLRQDGWAVTVAVRQGRDLIGIWPGFRDLALGVAFDVGSTTIAGHLCDLLTGAVLATNGAMNPQIGFGEDLMSRVSYVMMNDDGAQRLTRVVRDALDELLGELVTEAGVDRGDVLELSIVGNPIMHHLALGLDPRELGTAPFALATTSALHIPASELGLRAHDGARVYSLPCIAGHVGADAAGAVLSEGPHRAERLQLLVDVGTNAELVLGNKDRLLAASSPTGPAFEGAQISSGQRAAPGAIERVRIDPSTLEPRFSVIGQEVWSDEPGFDSGAVTGICGSGIIEVIAELHLAGVIDSDGVIRPPVEPSPRVVASDRTFSYVLCVEPLIEVTQNDVRAVQLAKAALHAGARLLMDHYGVEKVDEIRLAGAFGSHIDPLHAMVLGMIPDCDISRVSAAGNAAGVGAMMALLSGVARTEIEEVALMIEKVETAVEPRFQEHFVAALAIPHKSDPYPLLSKVVDLPPRPDPGERRRRRPG
ncbi:MAG TPA: ASKHA domain-containing protein [Acidimicrobiia bacterium]|nr:ASKHA domain-containing protein [Acidimicrobiia bacterium]